MASDKDLHDLVVECGGSEDYLIINYVCLRKSTLLPGANIFGVLTAIKDSFTIYFLKPTSVKMKKENVFETITIPMNTITKIKVGKFIIWNSIKIKCTIEGKECDLKFMISDKVMGIKQQKDNAKKLAVLFRVYKLEHKI